MTIVSMIVAAAEDNAIGKHNDLLWHLPDDFKFFKDTTIGHPIVMGRKTFQALGKALPKRLNIVITRQTDFEAPGAEVVGDIDSALIMARDTGTDEIMVIGVPKFTAKPYLKPTAYTLPVFMPLSLMRMRIFQC